MLQAPGLLAWGPGPRSASLSSAPVHLPALFSQTSAPGGRQGHPEPSSPVLVCPGRGGRERGCALVVLVSVTQTAPQTTGELGEASRHRPPSRARGMGFAKDGPQQAYVKLEKEQFPRRGGFCAEGRSASPSHTERGKRDLRPKGSAGPGHV